MSHSNQTNNYTEFYYHFFKNILVVSLPLLIVSALILSIPRSSADGVDTLTLTLSSSCTMSSVVDIEHNGSLTSGTYIQGIGQTTIKTLCNDGNGYSVYANGYSNNEEGNNKLINSSYPQYSIDTGLATIGLISTWAMKLNNIPNDPSPTPPTIESDYNNVYGIVPNVWTKVASRQSGTTDMDEGSSFTTTYAVYASSNQHAGTYVGQVKYMLMHPNSDKPTLNNLEVAFASHGIQPAYQDEYGSYFAMQDMTTEICNSVSRDGESTAAQLVDIRDNKIYWVAKLADGHCWMTQNLDFDIVADAQGSTKMETLTSENTDLTDHSLTGAYSEANGYSHNKNTGIISWVPATTAETINFSGGNNTTVTGWQNSNNAPYSASKTDDANTGHASLGNYYNWAAAIASNDSSMLTSDTLNNISQNPKNSICPKGWRLPTISSESGSIAGSTNEFARLNYLYNNNLTNTASGLLANPIFFIMAGEIAGRYETSQLRYISSTVKDQNNNYFLQYKPSDSIPLNLLATWTKSSGRSIRCLAR